MTAAVLQAPAGALRTVCVPVDAFDENLRRLAESMEAAMLDGGGVGLAANQIGANVRLIVIRHQGWRVTMANPVIRQYSKTQQRVDDGCLSVDGGGRRGTTLRALEVFVEWQDLDGAPKRARFKGLRAAILQHEIDHLDGILFIDRLPGGALMRQQA
jgi:peptide deformylase